MNFTEKIQTRADLSLEIASEVFEAAWEEGLPIEALAGGSTTGWSLAHDDGLKLLNVYLDTIAPSVTPHLVEHRFRFKAAGIPIPIIGTVDLIDQNGIVIDHKTSHRPYNPSFLADDLQLICYAIGYGTLRAGSRLQPGKLPPAYFIPKVQVDVLITTDPPTHQRLQATYSDEQLRQFVDRCQAVARGIRSEAFSAFWKMAGRECENSVCGRCPFRSECKYSLSLPGLLEANRED